MCGKSEKVVTENLPQYNCITRGCRRWKDEKTKIQEKVFTHTSFYIYRKPRGPQDRSETTILTLAGDPNSVFPARRLFIFSPACQGVNRMGCLGFSFQSFYTEKIVMDT